MDITKIIKKTLKMHYVVPMLLCDKLASYHLKAYERNRIFTAQINQKVLNKYDNWGYFE